jgi:hypothetical protein
MDYFVFKITGEDRDAVVDALPRGAPTEWRFHEGTKLAPEFPKPASMRFSDNFPDARVLKDFVSNLMGLLIVSGKVRAILEGTGAKSLEFLDVEIRDHRDQIVGKDYAIVNPLGAQPAIDMKKSKLRMSRLEKDQIADIDSLMVDRKAIDKDAVLFRAATFKRLLFARADLIDKLNASGIQGFKAFPADGWDGLDL